MSTLEERVNADLATLATLADAAAAAKESGAAVGKVHRSLTSFVSTANGLSDEEKYAVIEQVGEKLADLLAVVESAKVIGDHLNTLTGQDREAGDAVAKRLASAVESGYLEGDLRDRAEKLVGAWRETAPKGRGARVGGGDSDKPKLPFAVKVKCEHDGWEGIDRTDKNSARWNALKHHAAKHSNGVKPGKGDAVWQGITEAIDGLLTADGAGAFQGGGYIVTKGE